MSLHRGDLARWNRVSLGLGGCVWGVIAFASLFGWIRLNDLGIVLLLVLFVITPLTVPLVLCKKDGRFFLRLSALVLFFQPLAALLGSVAFFLDAGPLAAAFAAVWFVFTGLLALLGLRFVVPTTTSRFAQVLLALSYTTVFFTMLVAGAYALGVAMGAWTITISQMIAIHGLENALIFGFCGLLGWRIRTSQESQGRMRGEKCA